MTPELYVSLSDKEAEDFKRLFVSAKIIFERPTFLEQMDIHEKNLADKLSEFLSRLPQDATFERVFSRNAFLDGEPGAILYQGFIGGVSDQHDRGLVTRAIKALSATQEFDGVLIGDRRTIANHHAVVRPGVIRNFGEKCSNLVRLAFAK